MPDAAQVGAQETTMDPAMYRYGDMASTRLWDIPGAGTARFPSETYVRDMGLRFFDVAVLVTATRVTEVDRAILAALRKFKVPCLAVRTKIDIDIRNEWKDNDQSPDFTLRAVHAEMERSLGSIVDIFMTSKKSDEYDLPRLQQNLLAFVIAGRQLCEEGVCPFCLQSLASEKWACVSCETKLCTSCVETMTNQISGLFTCPSCCSGYQREQEAMRLQQRSEEYRKDIKIAAAGGDTAAAGA
jgi:hypothetical protein